MKDEILSRRFPKILAEEVLASLRGLDALNPDLVIEYLRRFRSNRAKTIAQWGILNIGSVVSGLEFIPIRYLQSIDRLDVAFEKLHRYRGGGAADYLAVAVVSEAQRQRARRSRKALQMDAEILRFLQRKDYANSDNKKAIVADAKSHFERSESTIRRIARNFGLVRKGKKSTVTSR